VDFNVVPAVRQHSTTEHYIECALFGDKRVTYRPNQWFPVRLYGTLPAFRMTDGTTKPVPGDTNVSWRVFLPGQTVQLYWDTRSYMVRGQDNERFITSFDSAFSSGSGGYTYQYWTTQNPRVDTNFTGMMGGVGPPIYPPSWGMDTLLLASLPAGSRAVMPRDKGTQTVMPA